MAGIKGSRVHEQNMIGERVFWAEGTAGGGDLAGGLFGRLEGGKEAEA